MTTDLSTQTDGGVLTYRTDHVDEEQFDDERSLQLLLIAHAATIVGETLQIDAADLDVSREAVEQLDTALEVAVEISEHATDPSFQADVTTLDDNLLEAAREDLAPLGPPLCGIDVDLPDGTAELTIDDLAVDVGRRGS